VGVYDSAIVTGMTCPDCGQYHAMVDIQFKAYVGHVYSPQCHDVWLGEAIPNFPKIPVWDVWGCWTCGRCDQTDPELKEVWVRIRRGVITEILFDSDEACHRGLPTNPKKERRRYLHRAEIERRSPKRNLWEMLSEQAQKDVDSLFVQHLSRVLNYTAVGRSLFSVEPLPSGALPIYDKNPDVTTTVIGDDDGL
jgi:hypothetical protein